MTKTLTEMAIDDGIRLIDDGDRAIAQRDEWKKTYLSRKGMKLYEQARLLPAGPLRDAAVAEAVRA